MYDLKVKSAFVHFRAQGMTIQKISEAMGINRTTLIQWNKELYADIKIAERDEYDKIFEAAFCDKIHRVSTLAVELGACYDKLALREERTDKLALLKEIEKLTRLLHMETEDKKFSNLVQKSSANVSHDFPIIVNDPHQYRKFDEDYENEDDYAYEWDESLMEDYTEEQKEMALKLKAEHEAALEEAHEQVQAMEEEDLLNDAAMNCVITPLADTKRSKRIINKSPDAKVVKNEKKSRSFKKLKR